MHIQFRNIDDATAPQDVSIKFIWNQRPDEEPELSFLLQDYTGEGAEDYRRQDDARMAAYEAGVWSMQQFYVTASIRVPIGQGAFTLFELESAGIGNVESDVSSEYEIQIWTEEEASLRAAMKLMGAAFANL